MSEKHRVPAPAPAPAPVRAAPVPCGTAALPLRLVVLTPETLRALLDEDLDAARRLSGAPLTPFFVDQNWLWRIRVDQIREDPSAAPWVARAVVDHNDRAVGTLGFHGPPDLVGMVEVGYSVDPAVRRRGYASEMVRLALAEAVADPRVCTVRTSISPDNVASLGTIAPFGFVYIGDQMDEEDGRELVFEWDATR